MQLQIGLRHRFSDLSFVKTTLCTLVFVLKGNHYKNAQINFTGLAITFIFKN
jgi:hypothetical protein